MDRLDKQEDRHNSLQDVVDKHACKPANTSEAEAKRESDVMNDRLMGVEERLSELVDELEKLKDSPPKSAFKSLKGQIADVSKQLATVMGSA